LAGYFPIGCGDDAEIASILLGLTDTRQIQRILGQAGLSLSPA